MEILNVLLAAIAAYGFGAVWYMALAQAWIKASGVAVTEDGKPAGGVIPYVLAFLSALIVAGMMRHIFSLSGIETAGSGVVSGLGIGLFLASPWILTCYGFSGRSFRLILIDGGFVTFSCMIIGLVLTLF
ncbi:hypothetical protein PEL8287_02223 [Roseovarius litorisediminis]|uniref:DUF1761 domain-containing protein n=1 Tax=Roseovarius litorisediminis TaxID=1312363 RepID=A0A1Y5SS63_9RHOB|nr:DUF1761 domain-containing protein [Roseovarius litorisediminis]SLN44042.1 hypothetical protein PEL8287_02223 [Roseovarius litorisediminis]